MDTQISRHREDRSAKLTITQMREGLDGFSLKKKPRPFDDAMGTIMFVCGVISILTTIGIVLVLGSESLRFFTSLEFLDTNKETAGVVGTDDNVLPVESSGFTLNTGDLIQVDEETMIVAEVVSEESLRVERGADGTQSLDHEAGREIYLGNRVTISEFVTGTVWQPQIAEFGFLPLLNATLMISLVAMLVALPLGLGTAIYLSEYASERIRAWLKPILEILAGIPTVVYGYFALTFMTPLLRVLLGSETVEIFNMASAGLVMGIMIIPIISSMSEDAISAVPRSLREASYGLGATKLETVFNVLLPAALSGIIAAVIVGVSRAVGETMIVAIAAGAGPRLSFNPFKAAETITGHIARISTGDLSFNSIDYNSLFALGLTLFIFTFSLNILAGYVTRRFREVYQ